MRGVKGIKIKLIILFIAIFAFLSYSVTISAAEYLQKLRISSVEVINLNIDGSHNFLMNYVSSDDSIFEIEGLVGKAKSEGSVYLTLPGKQEKKYIVVVKAYYDHITIEGDLMIDKEESTDLKATVSPVTLSQEVSWSSSDETIAIVDENGRVTGVGYGIATIYATSKVDNECVGKTIVLVDDDSLEHYEDIVKTIYEDEEVEHINATSVTGLLQNIVNQASLSVIGIEKYTYVRSFFTQILTSTDYGTAVVYRRDAVLTDGTIVKNVTDVREMENFSSFKYYAISSRHVVKGAVKLMMFLGEGIDEVEASIMQYDEKIDLSVVTFETTEYIPTIVVANSDEIKRGEFVVAIGNGYSKEYFRTATFGIVSYEKRYVATDTDSDGISDWDSEFIQHDASINSQTSTDTTIKSGSNGGALINMKGQLIGINSTKISTVLIENMSFAIPSNLVMDIVGMLENGIKPERPLLGVEILDLKNYYQNVDYYQQQYPGLKVPEGLEYGFYVNNVTQGGVANKAGVLAGDIIIEFDGDPIRYSYQLRAKLGEFIIGSGEQTTIKVLRNGEEVTLTVTF